MIFEPNKKLGNTIGGIALGVVVLALVLLFALVFLAPFSFRTVIWLFIFLLLSPVAVLLGLRLYGLRGASYQVSPSGIQIQWGMDKHNIPMHRIERIMPGSTLDTNVFPRSVWWPGLMVGSTTHPSFGRINFYATTLQREQLFVLTDKRTYAISPADPRAFLDAYATAREQEAEVSEQLELSQTMPLFQRLPFWRDRWAQVLLPGTFFPLLLFFGLIAFNLSRLPASIPLHFNQLGEPDRMGTPAGLFMLPVIGLVTWLANTALGTALHSRPNQRILSYVLWFGNLLVQALLWAGALYILSVAGR
jgi:hypothetical protein